MLDAKSALAGIGEANAESFQRASLLVATWDTLGFILFEENKLDEAQDYLRAAWVNQASPDVGQHYGELLEKEGKPTEALWVYELAQGVVTSAQAGTPEIEEVKAAIKRLEKEGTKSNVSDATKILQDERSFTLVLNAAHKDFVSATFRLQFSAEALKDVLRVSGDPALDEASDTIRGLHLPQLVPTHSTARLLRDAVVTCTPGRRTCFFVLTPLGGINVEAQSN